MYRDKPWSYYATGWSERIYRSRDFEGNTNYNGFQRDRVFYRYVYGSCNDSDSIPTDCYIFGLEFIIFNQ